MSANVHILVEFKDSKPHLTLGRTPTVRGYTRKGAAENYAKQLVDEVAWRNDRRGEQNELPDIQILSIAIPDEGPIGEGIWPELVPEIAVKWS